MEPLPNLVFYRNYSEARMTGWRKKQIADMFNETVETMPNNNEKYSDEYDAFYNEETNEWLEPKCDDPTCPICVDRPERPL
jgi:hypothetical protein